MASDGIRLYRTADHPCGYYADRISTNHVLDPHSPLLADVYGRALQHGFRRAADIVYRPDCGACNACVPYRLPVAAFRPDRAQRRVLAANADIDCRWLPAAASEEHFELYRRYLGSRHASGGMDQATREDFERFLLSRWADTRFMELRLHDRLIGCAVTDLVELAASAVYTYFDPELQKRSLGTLAILKQIDFCLHSGRDYLYLGFWIDQHPKMHYKRRFGPGEVRIGGHWLAA